MHTINRRSRVWSLVLLAGGSVTARSLPTRVARADDIVTTHYWTLDMAMYMDNDRSAFTPTRANSARVCWSPSTCLTLHMQGKPREGLFSDQYIG